MTYLTQPPRAWSRVQSIPYCTAPDVPSANRYKVYVPRTNQYISPAEADLRDKIIYKGNILQYKNNSSNLTKKQRYSQIAKGKWTNNTKSYATQSITYTNPNTSGLLRVNYTAVPPNDIPGAVNNASGPYQYNVPNPFGCSSDYIIDGGKLICNTLANTCTNQLIKTYDVQNCFSITASDVPGFNNPQATKILCWDPQLNTWYPRTKLTMNNSGNKWPQNYKEFVSACKPTPSVTAG